ncbi:MAG: YfhO family protein, partial [Nitrospinae bacterium]|nr:YfhO family protein [Nitrospinota bacterium]
FDPLKEVLLSQPVEFEPTDHFAGKVEEVSYRPNHVTVKTSQAGNGFLVLMDSYFSGWTVKVDGQERPILRANHYYRAVQLGPGVHTLEFDYFPDGFKAGLAVSGITLVLVLVGGVLGRKYLQNLK